MLVQDPTGATAKADPSLTTYLDRPILPPHLVPAWETFWRLSRRRPVGFGMGAIPLTEIESYCRLFNVDDPERREWLFVRVDALDVAYIDFFRRKEEEKTKQQQQTVNKG